MTPEDVIAALDAMEWGDEEIMHSEADKLLLALLRAQGYSKVAEAYERARDRVGFWYA